MSELWFPYLFSRVSKVDYSVVARPAILDKRDAEVHPDAPVGCYLCAAAAGLADASYSERRWFFVRDAKFSLFGVALQLTGRIPPDEFGRAIRGVLAFYNPSSQAPLPKREESVINFAVEYLKSVFDKEREFFELEYVPVAAPVALSCYDYCEMDARDPWLQYVDVSIHGSICCDFPDDVPTGPFDTVVSSAGIVRHVAPFSRLLHEQGSGLSPQPLKQVDEPLLDLLKDAAKPFDNIVVPDRQHSCLAKLVKNFEYVLSHILKERNRNR